jgi:hypothetical protein
MMEVEDPARPAGTVALVMQAGYVLNGRLLRPAMVGVAKGGPKAGNAGPDPERPTVQAPIANEDLARSSATPDSETGGDGDKS